MEEFNIVLTSSGFNDVNNYVSDESRELFARISKGKRIMIIANAAPEGTGNYIARENVRNNFLAVGASVVDIVDVDENNVSSILDYDIIYVLGGNPTFLIELNKIINFRKYILEFLENGIYIGESCGSMILCDDLEWVYAIKRGTKKKYDIYLDSYKGLDLSKRRILPHYNKLSDEVKEKALKYEEDYGIKFDRLNDGEYILEYYKREKEL